MEHIESYLHCLEYEKRYSPHTVAAYRRDLSQFGEFVQKSDHLFSDIDFKWIRRWIVTRVGDGDSSRTVNRKIAGLRSFFKYLMKEGLLTANPMDKVGSLKTDKRLPTFVSIEKMDEMLDREPEVADFSAVRSRMVVELFYMTGIRLSELIHLKEKDVDIRGGTIKVLGKRNKERIIPLIPEFCSSLGQYLLLKNASFPGADLFFLLDSGKPLYARWVQRLTGEKIATVTSLKKRSPHVLRHSFATNMLDNGADLNAIKELLGHANLAATQVYTHNSLKRIKKVYKQAHPRA
jgi:integrase/recombinase XerC